MNCPKCHKEIPDGSRFCLECGSSVSGESADEFAGSVGDGPTLERGDTPSVPSIGGEETLAPEAGESSPGIMTGTSLSKRYETAEELGSGGFARVFKARDRKLGRTVAVKRLRPEHSKGKGGRRTVERFVRESQAIAGLNHRNVVQVFDADRDADGYYIVMEYVDGGTLREHLKEHGRLDLADALPLFRGIAQGLAYAHRHNLVHRDMKPANVLLARHDGELVPKIVDFGLARAGADSDISVTGYGMGTPYYMPPEQRRDAKNVNHTADIYALGKILYEMVSGEIPDNVDPEAIPPPPELAQIVFRAIKSRPEERYFSVEDMLRDLDALAETNTGLTRTDTGRRASGGNPCPSCGASNPEDVKFCEECGTGLTRLCPECERENSVHKRYCGNCGTDVEAFGEAERVLRAMQRQSREHRWSRVLKEYGELPEAIKLPGTKGGKMLSEIEELRDKAKEAAQSMERLRRDINVAESEEKYREALEKLDEYLTFAPQNRELQQQQRQRVETKLEHEAWELTFQKAQTALDQEDFTTARVAFEDFAKSYPKGGHAAEAIALAETKLPLLETRQSLQRVLCFRAYPRAIYYADCLREQLNDLNLPDQPIIEGGPSPNDILQLIGDAYWLAGLGLMKCRTLWSELRDVYIAQWAQTLTNRQDFDRARQCAAKLAEMGGFEDKAVQLRTQISARRRQMKRRWLAALGTVGIILILLFASTWAVQAHKKAQRPKLRIVPTINGKEVSGAKVGCGGEVRDSSHIFGLTEGKRYAVNAYFKKDQSKTYLHGSLAITADWTGEETRRIQLEETTAPVPNEDWTSPATGMEFVWVPKLKCWVGKYEVTNGEYRKKEHNHDSKEYKGHNLNGDRQPVVEVNYAEAQAYADWLTERDRDVLGGAQYRLPTKDEFTTFAQCGDGREYPWGDNWPPRSGQAGNYHGQEGAGDWSKIDGYRDGHPVTCDVEKSWKNPCGLYGVGGNVWECTSESPGGDFDAWRGASWFSNGQDYLRCEYRFGSRASYRSSSCGFRVLLFR